MPTDYREVLKDLRAEEKRLTDELEIIRGMIPGAELMARRMPEAAEPQLLPTSHTKAFAKMGTREGILHLLGGANRPLMPAEITRMLLEGGVQTRSTDFSGMVGSTLTQLRGDDLVERKDEGWVITSKAMQAARDKVTVSPPAPHSLAATHLYPTNASQRPLKQ